MNRLKPKKKTNQNKRIESQRLIFPLKHGAMAAAILVGHMTAETTWGHHVTRDKRTS